MKALIIYLIAFIILIIGLLVSGGWGKPTHYSNVECERSYHGSVDCY